MKPYFIVGHTYRWTGPIKENRKQYVYCDGSPRKCVTATVDDHDGRVDQMHGVRFKDDSLPIPGGQDSLWWYEPDELKYWEDMDKVEMIRMIKDLK